MKAEQIFCHLCSWGCLLLILLAMPAGCSQEDPGEAVYRKNCSQCHATSGQGLRKLYPPLDKSPYLTTRIEELPCLIVYGSKATIKTTDRGRGSYMPPIKTVSTPEMLLLFDFLQRRWSSRPVPVNEPVLVKWLSSCSS